MNARSWRTAPVLLALLVPGVAGAEGLQGRFSIAFQGGTQSELGGDILKGASGALIWKPTTLESASYRDVYAPDLRLQGVLGYGLGERTVRCVGEFSNGAALLAENGTGTGAVTAWLSELLAPAHATEPGGAPSPAPERH
jgi:hypothetical protein